MGVSADEVLRDIILRHGVVLLDDHRRCESCLRDSSLGRKEQAGLLAALKAGIPKRIVGLAAFGERGVANLAAELSDSSGLSEQLALSSVRAWAHALHEDEPEQEPRPPDIPTGADKVDSPEDRGNLSEAILGVVLLAVLGVVVFNIPASKFEWSIPSYIVAIVGVTKCVKAIVSYAERFWRRKPLSG